MSAEVDPKLRALADKADDQVVRDYLEALNEGDVPAVLEFAFITLARGYSYRKLVSYKAWRNMGVPARVLRDAGVSP